MRNRYFLIIFLSFFSLAMSPLPQKPSLIKGKVVDAKTLKTISGAKVRLTSLTGGLKASALTDASGNYELKNLKFPTQGSFYILRASKDGYSSKSTSVFLRNNKTYAFNFKLTPLPKQNSPPQINSFSPETNSTFLAGAKIEIKLQATDPDNDHLEYQFSIAGVIKQPWFSANTFSWQTTTADTASVDILYEVRDNKAGAASKTISLRIINPTTEEILQKVADNYVKIYDYKADMVVSATLNNEPFGETEYCRYYFKTPDKEKTETFSDSNYTQKTTIVINNGTLMHFIDTVNNTKQTVDLLTETGADSSQFSQMDLIYNQAAFLNSHVITRNNLKTDFNNLIIALEAVPKEKNIFYAKIELSIDYNKGILNRTAHFTEGDDAPQVMETVEARQMPNGAFLVSKFRKIPNLSDSNLIVDLVYNNLQANTGLTDADFDPDKQ